jgi:CheY-like chemotaxis protein
VLTFRQKGKGEQHNYRPNVAILGIGMPGMSGYEVARRLREQADFQNTLPVAVTGRGSQEDRRRTQKAGFDFHLTKPASLREIKEMPREPGTRNRRPGK